MMFDYVDPSDFKIYMNDIGLLTQHPGMPALLLLSDIEIDNTFMGGGAQYLDFSSRLNNNSSKKYSCIYDIHGNS